MDCAAGRISTDVAPWREREMQGSHWHLLSSVNCCASTGHPAGLLPSSAAFWEISVVNAPGAPVTALGGQATSHRA